MWPMPASYSLMGLGTTTAASAIGRWWTCCGVGASDEPRRPERSLFENGAWACNMVVSARRLQVGPSCTRPFPLLERRGALMPLPGMFDNRAGSAMIERIVLRVLRALLRAVVFIAGMVGGYLIAAVLLSFGGSASADFTGVFFGLGLMLAAPLCWVGAVWGRKGDFWTLGYLGAWLSSSFCRTFSGSSREGSRSGRPNTHRRRLRAPRLPVPLRGSSRRIPLPA